MIDLERLKNVTPEELDTIFRIARLALEIDNGSGHYEEALEKTSNDIDSIYVVLEETLNDK